MGREEDGSGTWEAQEGGSRELGSSGEGFEETWENGQGWHEAEVIGKMGHGKTGGVPGEKGVPGDKGVPGEDGEVEKAAQLLCSGEMLLWSSLDGPGSAGRAAGSS